MKLTISRTMSCLFVLIAFCSDLQAHAFQVNSNLTITASAVGQPGMYSYTLSLTALSGVGGSTVSIAVGEDPITASNVQYSGNSLTADFATPAKTKAVSVFITTNLGRKSNTVSVLLMKPHITGVVAMYTPVSTGMYEGVSLDQLCDFDGSGAQPTSPCMKKTTTVPWVAIDVDIPWRVLQPSMGNPIVASVISDALQKIDDFNQAHPGTHITAKLRISSGQNAPLWTINGGTGTWNAGVSMLNHSGQPVTYPQFWDTAATGGYHAAWVDMLRQVATAFDSDSRVQEIGVTSCSSHTNEPFVWDFADASTSQDEHPPAGVPVDDSAVALHFTDEKYQECLTNAITDYTAVFLQTPVDYTFNQYICAKDLNDGPCNPETMPPPLSPLDFSLNLMAKFRTTPGSERVVANHDLQAQPAPAVLGLYMGESTGMYAGSSGFGIFNTRSPIEFQTLDSTITPASSDAGYRTAIDYAICQAPVTELELFPSARVAGGAGTANYTTDDLTSWAAWLAGGVPQSANGECSPGHS